MSPELENPRQVTRVLERAPARDEPAIVFLIGAGGSGKSFLAKAFGEAVSHHGLAVVQFDDSEHWGMDRWEDHIGEYGSVEDCQKAFLKDWIEKVRTASRDNKLVIADVNTDPSKIIEVCNEIGISNFQCVLVQPSNETRRERLANDETRISMPREALRAQMDDNSFPEQLQRRAGELGLPHIANEKLDINKSLNQLSSVCLKLLKGN